MIFKYTIHAKKAALIRQPFLLKDAENFGFVTGISAVRYDEKVQIA